MIPVAKPFIGEEEIEAVAGVMRSGMLAQGSVTTELENNFAKYCGVLHAVGVNSGTAALHMGLLALGIGPGDEVIVPSFTFIATATAVSMCGARPVFADVTGDTYTIDPENIKEKVTDKTKAVIGVHLFGQPFDIKPVQELCLDNKMLLIEDAAQAHGAMYNRTRVGTFGDIGCFSFYPTKNMTSGEGGIITTDSKEITERLRRLINHGQSEKYFHTGLGYNMRLSNISAAIGNVQLKKLDWMNKKREQNAGIYNEKISAGGIVKPFVRSNSMHVWHQYVIEVKDDFPMTREEFMVYLREKGIGSAVHYPIPVHMQPLYSGVKCECPVSERLASEVLSLPVHPGVSAEDCRYICKTINGIK